MSISSIGSYSQVQTYYQSSTTRATSGTTKTADTSAVAESEVSLKSVFDKLKQTFSNVNFVTGADPFARDNVRNNGRNTVYLDVAALRKLENDPKYAARIFADIESGLEVYGKGYKYTDRDRTYVLEGGAINFSFYGTGEKSKAVANCYVFSNGSKQSSNSMFQFGDSASANSAKNKTHRAINDIYNRDLKKWYDAFNVKESERFFYNFDEAWSKLQAARNGIAL